MSSFSRVRSGGILRRGRSSSTSTARIFYSERQSKRPREKENKSRSNRDLRVATTRPLSRPPRYAFIPNTDERSFRSQRRRSCRRGVPENETVTSLSRLSSSWFQTAREASLADLSPFAGFSDLFSYIFASRCAPI